MIQSLTPRHLSHREFSLRSLVYGFSKANYIEVRVLARRTSESGTPVELSGASDTKTEITEAEEAAGPSPLESVTPVVQALVGDDRSESDSSKEHSSGTELANEISYGGDEGEVEDWDEWVVRLATCRGWTTSHLNALGALGGSEDPRGWPNFSQPGRAADSRFRDARLIRRRRRRHQLPS
jgi:hypothetical protein